MSTNHAGAAGLLVEAKDVHKIYDTGKVKVHALNGVDLSVARGEMVAIMGPSGCGKTTLLNCLSGLDATDAGEILLEGTALASMSDRERTDYRALRMGFVIQFSNLMPVLSAVENVELPLLVARRPQREARERALAALELVGLAGRAHHVPDELSGGERQRVTFYFDLAPGVDPAAAATSLESALLGYGLEAESVREGMEEATAASVTFNRLIQGFMGLGLLVGVAALGVISARSVVERRQQIGVMRAIGFRRRMVESSFLLESSFIALTSIVVGTALGLLLAWNIIADTRTQPSWSNLTLHVPWLNLVVIFVLVYAVAMIATIAPARRGACVPPAEALRYE